MTAVFHSFVAFFAQFGWNISHLAQPPSFRCFPSEVFASQSGCEIRDVGAVLEVHVGFNGDVSDVTISYIWWLIVVNSG